MYGPLWARISVSQNIITLLRAGSIRGLAKSGPRCELPSTFVVAARLARRIGNRRRRPTNSRRFFRDLIVGPLSIVARVLGRLFLTGSLRFRPRIAIFG